MAGTLFIISTPIGNIKDITFRAVDLLRECDFILCEDTRETQKLLNYYSIKNNLISFFEHNQKKRLPEIMEKLKGGKNIALVSSRGTPVISDPGFFLVEAAVNSGIKVSPVPGASALLLALVASGLPADDFIFLGFLRKKPGKMKNQIREAAALNKTIVFYESPNRLKKTLSLLSEILPGTTKICIARELTKVHEEFIRGDLKDVLATITQRDVKGELVVLISPPKSERERR